MDAETLILAVLDVAPDKRILGRKRLQKLSYFATLTGTRSNVRFALRDFGPFSSDVAAATDLLAFVGSIKEEEVQVGRTKRYSKLYSLQEGEIVPERLTQQSETALRKLSEYSTIELEIASTISYFMKDGTGYLDAVDATKRLKPTKSQPKIIQRAEEALSNVGLVRR